MLDPASLIGSPHAAWSDGAARILAVSFAEDGLSALGPALADGAWAAFSDAQRASARAALAEFAAAAGLVFVEVPDSAGGALSDLRFRLEAFDPWWVAGRARPAPFGEVALSLAFGRDDSLAPGRRGFETLLHELGHALGLVHPGEGRAPFPAAADHRGTTIMSVNPGPDGVARTLRPLDAEALRLLYGAPEDRGFDWWWQEGRIAIQGEGRLLGTGWHDMLIGGAGADSLAGGTGDDILIGRGGADSLAGGAGFDVAVIPLLAREAALSLSADPAGGVRGSVGEVTVEGIEALRFLDGRLAFDAADPAAQAARLLSAAGIAAGAVRLGEAAALHRAPEPEGLAFWMELGDPLAIARGILASPEHRAVLGEGDPVALFYAGALGRAPEEAGHAFWAALLPDDCDLVLLGIAASAEAVLRADLAGVWPFA